MKKVFVSYSRKDLTFVKKLSDDLQKAGMDVWFDMSDLKGGDHWIKAIQQGIESSQYCIIVLSPDSIESEWVTNEYLHAKDSRIKLVPVMLRQCKVPLALKGVQFIDLQGGNYESNFDELLQVLDVKVRDDQKIAKTDSAKIKFDWRIGAGIGAIVALIAIGIVLANQPPVTIDPTLTPSATFKVDQPPTETITPVVTSTFTPGPTLTFTPQPTATPKFAAAWSADCLYTGYWSAYKLIDPASENDCLQIAERGIRLENKKLILDEPQSAVDTLFGIYMPVKGNAVISFTLQIDQLAMPKSAKLANISVGLVPAAISDLTIENLMFYELESAFDKTLALKTKEGGTAKDLIYASNNFSRRYSFQTSEKVTVMIENNKVTIYRNNETQFLQDITYRDRAFWIGFHLPKGGSMWATISEIVVTTK